tara:strand:+ start:2325 stop:4730 length:2406 start_codon:yes stop_codon:yes gene_type:complete
MKLKKYLFFILVTLSFEMFAQAGTIKGRISNEINNNSIKGAAILIENTEIGTTSDENGNYLLDNLTPGNYTITVSFLGFESTVFYDINVPTNKFVTLDITLLEETSSLDEIQLEVSPFKKSKESPINLQKISAEEIYRNPGGNRDISKVIQILPGVGSTVSFRNDIIVRGGAPNENRFYLDGIEVPNINHFATQGSSGGPVGMINVNFIKNVEFYSGTFPANRGNTLSSILEFEQITGNKEKLTGTFLLGSSDAGITLDGPMGEKSTFILSARRSYLQALFKLINLPFLPTYNDFQYKQSIDINEKNKLTIIGLGAIDDFKINTEANEGVTDQETIDRNNYILGNIPINSQWNYTVGINWKHYSENSNQTFVLSRNHLSNSANKYLNNDEQLSNLLLDYESEEIETKFRFENTSWNKGWKINFGVGLENSTYKNSTFNKRQINNTVQTIDFNSKINFNKFAAFGQVSRSFFNDNLSLSAGFRTDFNDYSNEMNNPLKQFSPRFSASYAINEKLSLGLSLGKYFQLPPYTILGYRDNNNILINKENRVTYIENNQISTGLEYRPTKYSKISLESFYKKYDKYPFLLDKNISLANLGADFGVIGNEAANSTSSGKSYGIELMMQQKLSNKIYGILSYTYVRSEFKDSNNKYVPSSWDNKHIFNIVVGKKLAKNWEVGAKFRLLGGAPYTPYDVELSSTKEIWDVSQQGINDWSRLNTERNTTSHSLDLRVDKKWYFDKWYLNAYLDIQNAYGAKIETQSFLDVVKDGNGNPVENTTDNQRYQTYSIENESGNVLPSIGIMIGF